jgi:hypothetical protein
MMVAETDVPSSVPYYDLGSVKPMTVKRSTVRSPIGAVREKRLYTFQTLDGTLRVCDTSETNVLERAIQTGGDISFVHFNANATQLLLNGVPLATLNNISSIADWALEPAISSINVAGYDVLNAKLCPMLKRRRGSPLAFCDSASHKPMAYSPSRGFAVGLLRLRVA